VTTSPATAGRPPLNRPRRGARRPEHGRAPDGRAEGRTVAWLARLEVSAIVLATGLRAERVGAALLVRRADPHPWTVGVARRLPAEPGRTPVVIDAGAVPAGHWADLATLLAEVPASWRRSLRLVSSWAGSPADEAPARILAECLGAEVIAPDGHLVMRAGLLFVGRPEGGGGWLRFVPGHAPAPAGIRHPAPAWERLLPDRPLYSRTGLVAEPVPAGLWVHRATDVTPFPDRLDNPAFTVTPDPRRIAVIFGGPAGSGVDDDEVADVVGNLPAAARSAVAVLTYPRTPASVPAARTPGTAVPAAPASAPGRPVPAPAAPAAVPPLAAHASVPAAAVPLPAQVPAAAVPPPAQVPAAAVPLPAQVPAAAVPPPAPAAPPAPARTPAAPAPTPPAGPAVTPTGPARPAAVPPPCSPVAPVRVVAGPRQPPVGTLPVGQPIEGGVAFGGGPPLEPSQLAPWWSPVADLFTVLVRYDAGSARFRTATGPVDPLRLAEAIAALPDRGARPVLLVTDAVPAGPVVQTIADALQAATIAGPQRQGRWWVALPRRPGTPSSPVRDMGAAYPFGRADLDALSAPAPPPRRRAASRQRCGRLVHDPADRQGIVLSGPGDPPYGTLRARLAAWHRQQRGAGAFGVAVGVDRTEPSAPFWAGGRPATAWEVASALADLGGPLAAAREVALLADPPGGLPDRQAQLLANYLRRAVLVVDRPLWTSDVDNCAGELVLHARPGGRMVPAVVFAGGSGWVRVDPILPAGPEAVAGKPAVARRRPAADSPPEPSDPRLAAILASGEPVPAGRRFDPGTGQGPRAQRLYRRLLAYPDRYLVTIAADRTGYRAGDQPVTAADLGTLLAASPGRAGRPVLLIAARGGEPVAVQRAADGLDAAVLATRGPAFASPSGLLVLDGTVYRHAPGAAPDRAEPVRPPGVRLLRLGGWLFRRGGSSRPHVPARPATVITTPATEPPAPPAPVPPAVAPPAVAGPAGDAVRYPATADPPTAAQAVALAQPPTTTPRPATLPPVVGTTVAPRTAPAPHDTAPPAPAPHHTAPHHTAPHHTAPHHTAPHHTAPHDTAPHDTAPHPALGPPAVPDRPGVLRDVSAAVSHGLRPGHRSTAAEQADFRARFARRYDLHARSVIRTLASRPGIRAASGGPGDHALVVDLVAVRAYGCDDGVEIDRALRSSDPSAALTAAACVASGLRRLPAFRGIVYRMAAPQEPGSPRPDPYLPGAVLIEPAFLTTVSAGADVAPAGTAFAIWSSTGRRTGSLELAGGADHVVFTAGTAFKVLAAHACGEPGGYVLLRELPAPPQEAEAGLDDEDIAMADRMRRAMSGRAAGTGGDGQAMPYRHTFPVGRSDTGKPYRPARSA
jgi:hypothetical protein